MFKRSVLLYQTARVHCQCEFTQSRKSYTGLELVLGCRSKGKQCKRFEGATRSGSKVELQQSGGCFKGRKECFNGSESEQKFVQAIQGSFSQVFQEVGVSGARSLAQHGVVVLCEEQWCIEVRGKARG